MTKEEAQILTNYAIWHLKDDEEGYELCSVCFDNCHCTASCEPAN
jgi:hypothetical protein